MLLLKKILTTKIIKNISYLVYGTILAMILPILFEPFLKRLYSPEDFGKLSLFLKAFNTIVIFSGGGYDMSIMIAKTEKQAKELVNISIFINICLFFVSNLIIILLFQFNLLKETFIFLLPISVFLYSVGMAFNNYMLRKERYKEASINKFFRRASEVSFQFSIKKFFSCSSGLILGNTFGNLFFFIYNFKISKLKIGFNLEKIKNTSLRYIDFPKYYLFPQVYNTFSTTLLDVIIFTQFSLVAVGYLELTIKILSLPSILLSESIGRVLLQNFSKKINEKKSIKQEVKIAFIGLGLLSIFYIVIILTSAPFLFKFVFGETWIESGKYAQYLIFYISISFWASTLSVILLALKKIKINSLWQLLKTTLLLVLLFFNYAIVKNFLIIYSLINTLMYILYLIIIMYEVYKYEKTVI